MHSHVINEPTDLYSQPYVRVLHLAEKLQVSPKKVLSILINTEIREYNLATKIFHSEIKLVTDELGIGQSIPSVLITRRPPIVSVMGHVDHGKTTLLDSLRNTNVAENEPGLITQHVSSFVVKFEGRDVTFIDTPGHAAFAGIRGRGAKINDITILVVDCCEGVQPQTKEVIRLIKEFRIPSVVALNKIDKDEANIEKTEQELQENGLELMNIPSVQISALRGDNLDILMRLVVTESDGVNLDTDLGGNPFGFILETSKARYLGGLATILPLRGIARLGTIISSGRTLCRIKAILLPSGEKVKEIGPGYPCTIAGWRQGLPNPGLKFISAEKLVDAKRMAKVPANLWVLEKNKRKRQILKKLFLAEKSRSAVQESVEIRGNKNTLCVLLKSDTEGSKEALETILTSTSPEYLKIQVFTSTIGDINLTDVRHAKALKAHILGFNVGIHRDAVSLLTSSAVPYFTHNVVYQIINYVSEQLDKMLPPDYVEERIGMADIISFPSGLDLRVPLECEVTEGNFDENYSFRVISKSGEIKYDGRSQDFELKNGRNFNVRFPFLADYEATDKIECYDLVLRKRKLFWQVNTE
ncbi:Initiation factor 2 [Oopsacas minuta]|uniref:Initiation factor 2 n=1 Tax=Oopsacas minuta TaxID=111878 RepID=A0AAV7JZ17_9METZ|nr:Initiation factor 2 [Oopsacas minuta]